jgi:hypothetical protein
MSIYNTAKEGVGLIKNCYYRISKDKQVNAVVKTVSDAGFKAGGIAVDAVKEKLDSATGQKMYDLVQERLAVQDQYNDVLAAKLHEALQRIEALEGVVNAKE